MPDEAMRDAMPKEALTRGGPPGRMLVPRRRGAAADTPE
jgi:hypothetical protein